MVLCQTAKMNSEFVFFSSNPLLNHIENRKKCLLLCATNTNIFTLLFKELDWFTGQDSPGGKVILEGKCRAKCATDVHELSQWFATAITFSSIQQRRHDSALFSNNSHQSKRLWHHPLQSRIWPFIDMLFRLDKNSLRCRRKFTRKYRLRISAQILVWDPQRLLRSV